VDHLRGWLSDKSGLIDQLHSRNILSAYGVPVVSTQVAKSADDAAALASNMGYPVVLKVMSPDISHKTDVGGVRLGLANADQVKAAYAAISESVRERAPSARWEGVSVQSMVSAARGVELLLGMKRDPIFGPVILLGAGGITAELQKDTVLELSPLDETTLEQMLRSLRLYPLLTGYRGRPGVDLNALRRAVMAFTQMTLDLPGLISAEVNPLLATAEGVTALDIRMIAG
jgi:acetyltransferase